MLIPSGLMAVNDLATLVASFLSTDANDNVPVNGS